MQNFGQKLLRPFGTRMLEKGVFTIVLDDTPLIHEDDTIGNALGKAHFVRHTCLLYTSDAADE